MNPSRLLAIALVVTLIPALMGSAIPSLAQGPEGQADAAPQVVLGNAASTPLGTSTSAPLGTSFTYQGQLRQGGNPVNSVCDFQFGLWDAVGGGSPINSTQTRSGVMVGNGYFTIPDLDFGDAAFKGEARWLEVAVRCPAGSGSYTTLTPRQALTAAPYALWARSAAWSALSGVPAGFADGVDNDTLAGLTCANGQIARWTGAAWACAADITAIYVGAGLTGGGESGAVTLSAAFAGNGAADTVARSDHDHDTAYWKLTGNSSTTPGTNFLGTSDNQVLELRVNNGRALRLEPNATSPNLIGGYYGNSVTAGAIGALIGGGGTRDEGYGNPAPNVVTDNYGTVGGGINNLAGNNDADTTNAAYAMVGGGAYNVAGSWYAFVGGGKGNTASGQLAAVSGGEGNVASGGRAVIAGGLTNTASGVTAAIGGGQENHATGEAAVVAGGKENTASGGYATIGGGDNNTASNWNATVSGGTRNTASVHQATVGGGGWNTASAPAATVAGGDSNTARNYAATVGGGGDNTASGEYATVPGGATNTAQGNYSFAAGNRARANHQGAFVWADATNADFASTADNQFAVRASGGVVFNTGSATVQVNGSTVWTAGNDGAGSGLDADLLDGQHAAAFAAAGHNHDTAYWGLTGNAGSTAGTNYLGTSDNQALELKVNGARALRLEPGSSPNVIGGYSGNAVAAGIAGATIGGGGGITGANSVTGNYGTVGGGNGNTAGYAVATVGGGNDNTAGGWAATVGGGSGNSASGWLATVAGGGGYRDATLLPNVASGWAATIGGGQDNIAGGYAATVPGGRSNSATADYSFAAGRQARANSQGCFVWGDSTNADVTCSNDNRWVARASGGVYFYTNSGLTSGVYVPAGGNAWSSVSDRNLKENFAAVDGQAVLTRLAGVPITTWNYKSQDPSIRHIGPVAQEFAAAFGVGEDNTHISTVDADGVALAAIQGLYQIVQEQDAEIAALKAENSNQQQQIAAIEARLAATERATGTAGAPLANLPAGWLLLGGLLGAAAVIGRRWYAGGGQ